MKITAQSINCLRRLTSKHPFANVYSVVRSYQNDGEIHIQTIVACLLEIALTRSEEKEEKWEDWMNGLSMQIYDTWAKYLGPGPKGTDVQGDIRAWLCLSRTVRLLVNKKRNVVTRDTESANEAFQFALSRCLMSRAFDNTDWLHPSVNEILQVWQVAHDDRQSKSWQGLAMSAAALAKLATSFPGDDPPKCLAIIECCTFCFGSSITVLQLRYLLRKDKQVPQSKVDDDVFAEDGRGSNNEISERYAIYTALETLESSAQHISKLTRGRLMQNKCFPLASSMIENMRSYARVLKGGLAPISLTTTPKQQSKLDSFFPSSKSAAKNQS
jgi:hypothetical protein